MLVSVLLDTNSCIIKPQQVRKTTKNKKSKIKNIKPHGKETNAMKTKFFTVNFITKEITGSERAFNRAGRGFEAELKELTTLMSKHEGFKLVEAEANKKKTTYEGLNRSFIREYIALNDPDRMPVFEAINKANKFPTVRKWFLDTYKHEGKTFNVKKETKKIQKSKTDKKITEAKNSVKVKVSAVSQKESA